MEALFTTNVVYIHSWFIHAVAVRTGWGAAAIIYTKENFASSLTAAASQPASPSPTFIRTTSQPL